MKSSTGSLISLALSVGLCAASGEPELGWDPDTTLPCTDWYDNVMEETCEEVRDYYRITPEEFHRWNPSVGVDCKPWRIQSYCIVPLERWESFTRTRSVAPSTTYEEPSSTVSTHVASPTAWSALGCYEVGPSQYPTLEFNLDADSGGDPDLSIAACEDACWEASVNGTVLFAGVRAGDQCWCSNFVGGDTALDESTCDTPCSGNPDEICGGDDRVNVFSPLSTSDAWTPWPTSSWATTASDATEPAATDATATATAATETQIHASTMTGGAVKYRALF